MKYFYYLLIIVFIGLIGYNADKIDWNDWDAERNWVSLASFLSGVCGLLLTIIMLIIYSVKKNKKVETAPSESEEEE